MQHATNPRDTKAEIHHAALDLFSAQGYEKTSLREIAEQVGITKASLYYHYKSKQELLRAIIGTFVDDIREVMARADGLDWSPAAARELLSSYLDVLIRNRASGPALTRDIGAVLASIDEDIEAIVTTSRQFQVWLAGPDPTSVDRIRAAAAIEALGASISAELPIGEISDAELHATLLDAAITLLPSKPD
ncbi:TetR/AcrR family transcriptional regulator [Kribbella antibiotica]|uniref:TetR/AcrR family transcriptional regulator n=1 Tax=Kribbella antibiotica TaxID=190195 RepID=A0A4R4YYU5_9ACTN|nr:TetR/AcrR family transcriptional regulator [Kribbella antibiotica]TDD50711.1 TetR/AcrR family transcriptional regulator [Kribbella antibiotica]